MLKKYEIFKIIQRLVDKNVIESKQVYNLKQRKNSDLGKRKTYSS